MIDLSLSNKDGFPGSRSSEKDLDPLSGIVEIRDISLIKNIEVELDVNRRHFRAF